MPRNCSLRPLRVTIKLLSLNCYVKWIRLIKALATWKCGGCYLESLTAKIATSALTQGLAARKLATGLSCFRVCISDGRQKEGGMSKLSMLLKEMSLG